VVYLKKYIFYIWTLLIALALTLPFTACSATKYEKTETPVLHQPMPPPEYPVIDGSSSTVAMHAAIRGYLTDEHFVDYSHSQTYAALERLIPGCEDPADVLLAVKYYDDTLKDAKKRGAELVITPVAKEGFVFILHKDNPVNSLTRQQLKDIYTGKITNWKDVGGNDELIIPYTRNWDSGSQTAMEDFMNGEEIVGSDDFAIWGMQMLLTEVERTSAGIGYNILSWSLRQRLSARDIKIAAVDGVAPVYENLSNNSYPLMVYTYSYYDKRNEKGKNLTEWLLTAEGQGVIAGADYVGIFGALPPEELPDLNKDEHESMRMIDTYYIDRGFDCDTGFFYAMRQTDKTQVEALSQGMEKDVTVAYTVFFEMYDADNYTRFIVLTRAKGGTFEVINEGHIEV
jgi:ABC-type phosphate transport system substrate-binding protein